MPFSREFCVRCYTKKSTWMTMDGHCPSCEKDLQYTMLRWITKAAPSIHEVGIFQ